MHNLSLNIGSASLANVAYVWTSDFGQRASFHLFVDVGVFERALGVREMNIAAVSLLCLLLSLWV